MNYAELRRAMSRIIPGMRPLFEERRHRGMVREKGRKSNYQQYDLLSGEWVKRERLLNTEEIRSFLEISMRAAACPMPFNMDIYDGFACSYNCRYCYANSFRASLYTSFFDNSRSMGIRHCNPDYYKRELDKLQPLRGQDPHGLTGIRKAFAMEIPVRLGIRFEDFLPIERRLGISLTLLEYLRDSAYPVMINTKSDLVGDERYVRALADNPAHAAVHVTLLSPNDRVNKDLEPGAPSYQQRMAAMRALSAAGVRVVARIEPYLFLVNDRADEIAQYAQDLVDAGVQHITFDTYSYSANVPGVRQAFMNCGYDFDRIFLAGCDSQQLGSLLLGKYMDEFRAYGLSCSTFDLGNVPHNDQDICCQVTDWFHTGWNYGSIVMAARYVISQNGAAVNWPQFHEHVMNHGGFLTEDLEREVHALWNMDGNMAYSIHWAQGLIPVGWDAHGLVWAHQPRLDTREHILATLMEGMS
jgi:DNA repair photolyase